MEQKFENKMEQKIENKTIKVSGITETKTHTIDGLTVTGLRGNSSSKIQNSYDVAGIRGLKEGVTYISNVTVTGVDLTQPQSNVSPAPESVKHQGSYEELDMK
jgi:hypothetical protein